MDKIFLEIENGDLINLTLVDRVTLNHHPHKLTALLSQGGMLLAESTVAYRYFMANRPDLIIESADVHAKWDAMQKEKASA